MFNRRQLLQYSAGASISVMGASYAFADNNGASVALNQAFDKMFANMLDFSPGLCTAVGFDKGDHAYQKSKLDHADAATRAKSLELSQNALKSLKAIDRNQLMGMDRINYDTEIWDLSNSVYGMTHFKGTTAGGPPYAISQLTGSYQSTPDFLSSMHAIETKDDAESYVARMDEFAKVLNEETANFNADCSIGIIPPDFVLERTLEQLSPMAATKAEDSTIVKNLAAKLKDKGITGDYVDRATKIAGGAIHDALVKQAEAVKAQQKHAVHDAGIWRLPDGAARYAYAVKSGTTTNMNAEEVHKLGLEKVKEISSQIDVIFKSQGMNKGTAGERMAALFKDPKQIYPNNDAAKEELLKYLNQLVDEVYKKVPDYFNVLPKSKVIIKRVPKEIEAGAPGGYYNAGTLDGSRPGQYYINLRDTAEQPRWLLPTLTHHEAVPGHHFQISIQQETNLPMVRKLSGFNAYVEGWALYAEQLSDEMGLYEKDPMGKIGYLHDALFRAVRLVVDSGMHAKRWSREQAITYMMAQMGDGHSASQTEIERYCVWPGQALGYMVGKLQWLKMRKAMQAHLGAKYSIKDFHDAGLLAGAVPLEVLEQVYRDKGYIA